MGTMTERYWAVEIGMSQLVINAIFAYGKTYEIYTYTGFHLENRLGISLHLIHVAIPLLTSILTVDVKHNTRLIHRLKHGGCQRG